MSKAHLQSLYAGGHFMFYYRYVLLAAIYTDAKAVPHIFTLSS